VTADDVRGVLPCHRDIKITAELRDSRPLANPMGRSSGRFAKKHESALMPLPPGNIFVTNPLPSPWVPLGLPRVYPPGWPLIPALSLHYIPFLIALPRHTPGKLMNVREKKIKQ